MIYDQNGKLNTWGSFRVSDKLEIDTLDTNTSSTTALVTDVIDGGSGYGAEKLEFDP